MTRRIALALAAALLLAVPARADVGRVVGMSSNPQTIALGSPGTWVGGVYGHWSDDATVTIAIPATLTGVTWSTVPAIPCTDADSTPNTLRLRCSLTDSPVAITVRGTLVMAVSPLCARLVAFDAAYSNDVTDCQFVTGVKRIWLPLVMR
jgi:hypothetical protein